MGLLGLVLVVGEHLVDQQGAAGTQHPHQLVQHGVVVLDVVQGVGDGGQLHGAIREIQMGAVAHLELHALAGGLLFGLLHGGGVAVDADDPGALRYGLHQGEGELAETGTHVQGDAGLYMGQVFLQMQH